MLFNSFIFILLFLPVVILVFYSLNKKHRLASAWLTIASLFFYGYWNPHHVLILISSILFNFISGNRIAHHIQNQNTNTAKKWLIIGILSDLAALAYYKYTGFLISNWNYLTDSTLTLPQIVLPLGISFFTFTQIAFLADAYKGYVREYNLIHYALFVTFFPHLLAGPVLHHKEMMPQFDDEKNYVMNYEKMTVGLTVFFMGLFKKVILADGIAVYVHEPFSRVASNDPLPLFDAWGAVLAYTLQIYFDFSGYSDMAIGISLFFGIILPINFNSPYKAVNIIEFWRRWHMTLSRFLRDYLYIPLGGNRCGSLRRYTNLMVTMLLGGLWHGANWTFLIWGGLHGTYLLINHAWQNAEISKLAASHLNPKFFSIISLLLTFLAVVVGWVFFRAENLSAAMLMLDSMSGQHGLVLPYRWLHKFGNAGYWLAAHGVEFRDTATYKGNEETIRIIVGLIIVWAIPNTQEIVGYIQTQTMTPSTTLQKKWWQWRASPIWLLISVIGATITMLSLTELSEFIYFQF